jgi:outer membrane lipoprotein-sorting protein
MAHYSHVGLREFRELVMKTKYAINLFLGVLVFSCMFMSGCSNNIIVPNDLIKNALLDSNKFNTAYCEGICKTYYTDSKYKRTFKIKNWTYKGGLNQRVELIDLGKTKDNRIWLKKGNKYINYIKKFNKAYIADNFSSNSYLDFRQDILENFAEIEEFYYISILGMKKINGFSTYHIKLRAKKMKVKIDIWVDKSSFFTVKEITEQGNIKQEVTYKRVDFSPKFPKSCFNIKLPKSVKCLNANNMTAGQNVSIHEAENVLGKKILCYNDKLVKLQSVNLAYLVDEDIKDDPAIITQKYQFNNAPAFQIITRKRDYNVESCLGKLGLNSCKIRGKVAIYKCDSDSKWIYWVEDGLIYEIDGLNPSIGLDTLKQIGNSLIK